MEMGIVYACMAKNADHNSWLQNVFDRSAMAIVTRSGTPLFEQDLATCVTEHFKDVLDQLHQQDACEDKAPEEDLAPKQNKAAEKAPDKKEAPEDNRKEEGEPTNVGNPTNH